MIADDRACRDRRLALYCNSKPILAFPDAPSKKAIYPLEIAYLSFVICWTPKLQRAKTAPIEAIDKLPTYEAAKAAYWIGLRVVRQAE